jgi:methanethiol S-methyltransferase
MLSRIMTLLYGVFCYVVFFATFLYAIGFIGNIFVPKSIDSGRSGTLSEAVIVDLSLLALFAIQHSLMARQWFKRAWTVVIPQAAERSTYVLFSSICLLLLFWLWRPIGLTIWRVDNPILEALILCLYAAGWVIVLVATFLIDHFDLFGLRQAWMRFRDQPYRPLGFQTPGFYKLVRHPLYVGWLLVFWSAPTMTSAHLVFSIATTAYILIAIQLEERDLVAIHGEAYERYREQVPMLAPRARDRRWSELPTARKTAL